MNYSKQEFERLFKDSYPHMYRMAFSMLENANDATVAMLDGTNILVLLAAIKTAHTFL